MAQRRGCPGCRQCHALYLRQAPSEAEATCAALAKSGLVWATATEDMDALAFGSPRLLRHLRVTGSG